MAGLAIGAENRETEAERVERWRIEYALDLGYAPASALTIALSAADLHHLEDLIRAGCPHELAAQILL